MIYKEGIPMQITKYEIKSEQDLSPLKNSWQQLEKGPEMTAFQTFKWQELLTREWLGWKLHPLYSRVVVYVASEGKRPVMIFPAIIYKFSTKTRWFGAKKGVYLMGQGSYSDYMNVIFETFSPAAFEAIAAEIKKDFPGFRLILSSIRHDASLSAYLSGKGVPRRDFEVSLTVRRAESPEAYAASLSKNTRAHLRKDLNKMERDGISYRIEVMGMVKDQALLKKLVDLHVQRILIKNTRAKGLLHILSAEVKKAYRKYRDLNNNIVAMSMNEYDRSVVILVWMNDEVAGYQYGLREKHAIRLLQTCFNGKYAKYSPLFRGVYDFIVQTYDDPAIEEVDFLRGSEEFKYTLGGQEVQLYEFDV